MEIINKLKTALTDEQIDKLLQSLRNVYSLGEVIDKIEYGKIAISLLGEDMGTAFAVDKNGEIYWFSIDENPNGDIPIHYDIRLYKQVNENTPLKRYIMMDDVSDPLIYRKENDADEQS